MNTSRHFSLVIVILVALTSHSTVGTGRLTVRVRDSETGLVVPARLVLRDSLRITRK